MPASESESVYTRTLQPAEEMDIRHGYRKPRSHEQSQIDARLRKHRERFHPGPQPLDAYHTDDPAIGVLRISGGRPNDQGVSQLTGTATSYLARVEDEIERAARRKAELDAEDADTAEHPVRDWLTLPEVARLTGYGRQILRTSIERKLLGAEQPNGNGGHYRIACTGLVAYLAARKVGPERLAEIEGRMRALLVPADDAEVAS